MLHIVNLLLDEPQREGEEEQNLLQGMYLAVNITYTLLSLNITLPSNTVSQYHLYLTMGVTSSFKISAVPWINMGPPMLD